MNKISVAERVPDEPMVPDVAKVRFAGHIDSRRVISKDEFPLALWRHELSPGASIRLESPQEDHTFYVVEGEILVGGNPVPAKGAASIGAHAISEIRGGATGATVLHYIGYAPTRPDKPGGCVHILSQAWVEHTPHSAHGLYLDSSCPSCSVWLHMTWGDKTRLTHPHYHTEDEIICVIDGEMGFGTTAIAPGGAIGVGKDVIYSFTRSEDKGLGFINFRQADPFFLPKGKKPEEAESERVLMRGLLQRLSEERLQGARP